LCGSCRPLIAELIGMPAPVPAAPSWVLLTASVAAAAIALTVGLASPVAFSTTIQDSTLDLLWRDGGIRQLTGFSVLGLGVMAMLLSLRKRWPRVSLGPFTTWRNAHAIIGVLTLVMLAVHTGMRLGNNVNFALLASFAAVNIAGAAAGGVTALEGAFGAALGARGRRMLVTAHIVAIWPLPLLVAFHVLAVYYF
jgi:nitrite reductase (NADH) large subunit